MLRSVSDEITPKLSGCFGRRRRRERAAPRSSRPWPSATSDGSRRPHGELQRLPGAEYPLKRIERNHRELVLRVAENRPPLRGDAQDLEADAVNRQRPCRTGSSMPKSLSATSYPSTVTCRPASNSAVVGHPADTRRSSSAGSTYSFPHTLDRPRWPASARGTSAGLPRWPGAITKRYGGTVALDGRPRRRATRAGCFAPRELVIVGAGEADARHRERIDADRRLDVVLDR